MNIFLTDGRGTWLGPYHPDEVVPIYRGTRYLREEQRAGQVWSIKAPDLAAAQARFERGS